MGRSGASCFKIMACGGDRAERDEVELPEVKCPGDKRRWSFQRRSARHQVPDDIVISEPVSVTASKMESPETSKTNFHLPINSYSPEKITVAKCLEESPPLSPVLVDSKSLDSLSASNDTNKINYLQESAVVVIQTAVRGYLAKRELRKCKNVVKLQAAVRGHLVRRQAIGTLRCVQAIIKMQTLVRAHYMRNNSETLTNKEELLTDTAKFSSVATGNFGANQNKYSSTEKLLKNGFARMLLKSTPRTKPIYISSDRLRSDSAWRWLERWMALTSTKDEKEEHNLNPECHKQGGDGNKIDNSEVSCESLASASYAISKSDPFKSEGFSKESTDSSSNPVGTSTLTPDELSISVMKEPSVDNSALVVADDTAHPSSDLTREAPDSDSGKTAAQLDATSQPCSKHVIDIEKSKRTTKRMICDSLEAGAAKSVGLVESCSPAFSAAKSKFEELIEAQTESTSSDQEVSNEVKSGDFHLQVDSPGFGTKIFLFSGVDLADRKTEDEIVLDTNPLKKNDDAGGLHDDTYDACNLEDNNSQHEVASSASEAARALKLEGIEENPSDLVSTLNSVQNGQPFAEPTDSASAVEPQADRSSPETSPRSHRTVPESLGTPSSQISVNVRSRKTDRKSSNKNPKSKLLKKKLPTTTNNDSDARMSTQNGKTNPVGKNNLDDVDPGTRVSSGTSLPSYMQPTESAKAKFHASNSPKSGPDVHDKDTNTRKRHSLPAENGKQESSPRMLRSTSLVQHSLKGNTSHSPHNSAEKKWQR